MNARDGVSFDLDLGAVLKEIRDEQPRPAPAQLGRLKRMALKKAQLRRWFRTTTAALTAATAIFAGIAVQKAFYSTEPLQPHPVWVAEADDDLSSADPWVGGAARRAHIEGDGWVPRPGVPNS